MRGFEADVARRERGEPVAYIRGLKEFYGLAFGADPRALIPRPETERLVELAEGEVAGRLTSAPHAPDAPPLRIVDVGTGAGTIAIALGTRLRKRGMADAVDVLATDVSGEALSLARENAVGHGIADIVRFAEADLIPRDEAPFDLVLANLPYIPSAVIPALPIAASFEPVAALDGGPDGLAVIRRLLARLPEVLGPGGVALLEMGSDQGAAIAHELERLPGDWVLHVEPDLSGAPRVASIERQPTDDVGAPTASGAPAGRVEVADG